MNITALGKFQEVLSWSPQFYGKLCHDLCFLTFEFESEFNHSFTIHFSSIYIHSRYLICSFNSHCPRFFMWILHLMVKVDKDCVWFHILFGSFLEMMRKPDFHMLIPALHFQKSMHLCYYSYTIFVLNITFENIYLYDNHIFRFGILTKYT